MKIIKKSFIITIALLSIIFLSMLVFSISNIIIDDNSPKIQYYYEKNNIYSTTHNKQEFLNNNQTDFLQIIIEFDYLPLDCDCKEKISIQKNADKVSEIIAHHRANQSKYYKSMNTNYLKSIDLSLDENIIISNFSPFIQIKLSNTTDFNQLSDNIENAITVKSCHVSQNIKNLNLSTISNSNDNYALSDVIKNINATDTTYQGAGLNVGILEADGIALRTNKSNELRNLTIHTVGTTENWHAANVTRLLCGRYGIAPKVNAVYIYHTPTTNDLINALNWSLSNNCVVINQSFGIQDYGNYHWSSALQDYFVKYQFVTIVNASGNIENNFSGHYTTSISMGYNTISVGAIDKTNSVANYSRYGANNNLHIRKPTLVAPGSNIVCNGESLGSGTSYAAPLVAGIVLKLMQEFPNIISSPETIIASLAASTTNVNGQSNSWNANAGAGKINYENARAAIKNCIAFTIKDSEINTIRFEKTAYFLALNNKRIKIVLFWLTNSLVNEPTNNVSINLHTKYELILRSTLKNRPILTTCNDVSNIAYIDYTYSSFDSGIVEVVQKSTSLLTFFPDALALTYCYLN